MKCFIRLLTLGALFSATFASSYYVNSDDESPSQKRAAETSRRQPYNILGLGDHGGTHLKQSQNTVSIGSTYCTSLGFKCNADRLSIDSYPDPNAPCPLQIDLKKVFEETKRARGLLPEDKINQLGFLPTLVVNDTTRIAAENGLYISQLVVAATDQIILSTGSAFEFGEFNVFATAGSVTLNFTNPASLVSRLILEFNEEVASHGTHPSSECSKKLFLGSIKGKASFLLGEESHLDFVGFSHFKFVFNEKVLQRLRLEGRL